MRLVLTSDLHGYLPPVQTCDVLLIAGDVCPIQSHKLDFQADWLKWSFIPWLRHAPARQKIFIAGNHDFIFYEQPNFIQTLDWPGIYLRDSGLEWEGVHFWGSPWANELPGWPFTAPEEELQRYWERIPDETQVLMVHGPPWGYGDTVIGSRTGDELHVGSRSLDETLHRLPNLKLMVFGHIHEGAGVYRHTSGLTLVNAALMDVAYTPTNMPRMYELQRMQPMKSLVAMSMLVLPFVAEPETKKEDREFFEQRVQPILHGVCRKCHGDERIRNNLDVSTREDLLRGGDHGPAIVPGKPEKSLLIHAVRYQDNLHMPPKGKLDADKLADLAEWVKRGAPWPASRERERPE